MALQTKDAYNTLLDLPHMLSLREASRPYLPTKEITVLFVVHEHNNESTIADELSIVHT